MSALVWGDMSPGERDALVADTMGFDREGWEIVPRYTSDIAAAWRVVEKMRETGRRCGVESDGLRWDAFCGGSEAYGDTPAEAICLAALYAVGVELF